MRYRKRHIVEDIIAQKFPCIFEIDNKKCFKVNENTFFVVSFLNWDREIIVAEYADSEFEATGFYSILMKCLKMKIVQIAYQTFLTAHTTTGGADEVP